MTAPARTQVATCLADTKWTGPQFLRGVRSVIGADVISDHMLWRWLAKEAELNRRQLTCLLRFVEQYPDPGAFETWEQDIATAAYRRRDLQEEAMEQRRNAVIREREDRVARLLAQERAPRVLEGGWFPSQRV